MNHTDIVQEKDSAEGFRSWIRTLRPKHPTRWVLAKAAFAELKKGTHTERIEDCMADVEDGFWQRAVEPEDLGLTWESWREMCRTHQFKGMTGEISINLRNMLENEEVSEEKQGELVRVERELVEGNITLEDIEITPEEWTTLCKKYNRHSIYSFHCVPKLFNNPVHYEKQEVDEEYFIELYLSGGIDIEEGSPKCDFNVVSYLVKMGSGKKHLLLQGKISTTSGVPKPDDMAKAVIENMLVRGAQIVIQTRAFQAEVLQ